MLTFPKRVLRFMKQKAFGWPEKSLEPRFPKGSVLSYSQSGEDRILQFLFDSLGIRQPSYIDVGAHHPLYGNSTFLFYSQGAHGVCVEPNPEFAAILRAERPRDVIVEAGVVPPGNHKLMYYMFREPTFNTFSVEEADIRVRLGGAQGELLRTVEVSTLTLDQLLWAHFPQGVDLLAIDVEGLDESLIRHSELAVRPKLLMIETVPFSSRHPVVKPMEVAHFLETRGYRMVADTYINSIFIDTSILSSALT